jgi:transposase
VGVGGRSGSAGVCDVDDGRRVVCSLFFFPRGGSAQVARALSMGLAAVGWRTTLVSGSLGASGEPTNAATFFSGIKVRPVDYTPVAAGADPLAASVPFRPSYEDRPGAPDRVFAAVSDDAYERLVVAWSENSAWGRGSHTSRRLPTTRRHAICSTRRVPNRDAMNAILLVLRTGMQWNALNATGICSCSSAYRRFREWAEAGVFLELWRRGLLAYDDKHGIEWEWLAMDGAMGKAPLGGPDPAPTPLTELKKGEAIAPHRGHGRPARDRRGGREPERLQAGPGDARVHPDRAAGGDGRAAARALSRQGLRLSGGVRACRRVRVHGAHPRPRRGGPGTQA